MRFRKNHRIQVSFKSVTNTKTTLTKCKDKTHTFEEDSINLRNAVKLWLSNKRSGDKYLWAYFKMGCV